MPMTKNYSTTLHFHSDFKIQSMLSPRQSTIDSLLMLAEIFQAKKGGNAVILSTNPYLC